MTDTPLRIESPAIFPYLSKIDDAFSPTPNELRIKMINNTWCVSLFAVITWVTVGYSQEGGAVPSRDFVREQLRSIAGAVVDSSGVRPEAEIVLVVESKENKTAVENSFLSSLQDRGIRVSLPDSVDAGKKTVLRISDVRFGRAGDAGETAGAWKTELDARMENPASESIRYLGHFVRTNDGTAGTRGPESVFGKILEPLVVISGTVLIVYLFFTVRS